VIYASSAVEGRNVDHGEGAVAAQRTPLIPGRFRVRWLGGCAVLFAITCAPVDALSAGTWRILTPSTNANPSAVLDSRRQHILQIGGCGRQVFDLGGSGYWTESLSEDYGPSGFRFYDPRRDRVVAIASATPSSDVEVWAFPLDGPAKWVQLPSSGERPTPRNEFAVAYDSLGDRCVLFSGQTDDYYEPNPSDVYTVSLGDQPVWSKVPFAGTPPAGRSGAPAVWDSKRGRLIVWGGSPTGDKGALWLSDSARWEPMNPSGYPTGQERTSPLVYDPIRDRLLFFGTRTYQGLGHWTHSNDVWWLPLDAPGTWARSSLGGPSPREWPALLVDVANRRLLIAGGTTPGYYTWDEYPDVWSLSLTGNTWTQLATPHEPPPVGTTQGVYDAIRDRWLVFDVTDHDTTLWSLALDGIPLWTPVIHGGASPSFTNPIVLDAKRDRLVVLWADGTARTATNCQLLDLASGTSWEPVVPTGTAPGRRDHCAAIYDPVGERMVLFGGSRYEGKTVLVGDTWQVTLGDTLQWSQLETSGESPPAGDAAGFYDPVRQRLVVRSTASDSLWALSLSGPPEWQRIDGTNTSGLPQGSLAYDNMRDRVLLSGVSTSSGLVSVWELGLAAPAGWTEVATGAGCDPDLRPNPTTLYDPIRDRLVVFGALDYLTPRPITYALTWGVTARSIARPLRPQPPKPLARILPTTPDAGRAGALEHPALSLRVTATGDNDVVLTFAIPVTGVVDLELFDVSGRRIAHDTRGPLPPGEHVQALLASRPLPNGVYLARLRVAGRSITARGVRLR
jgi:hypothetical protein